MDKSLLNKYINQVEQLNVDSEQQLRSLIDEYPYFQTARLLLSKNQYTTNRKEFERTLSTTSTLCADRKRLFYLINNEKYKLFLKRDKQEVDKDKRTDEILESYLTDFSKEEKDSNLGVEETIVSTDYLSFIQSDDENNQDNEENDSTNEFKHQDIIDSFLEKAKSNEISIQPIQKETKKSTKPDIETAGNSFLTETLAKIYIKQRKYEQALTIIQQLSLNFPKKSAYFADQIRFLELLILNEKNKK